MQSKFRRVFLMIAAVFVVGALVAQPAHAAKKKKPSDASSSGSQSTTSSAQPERDAKGHFVKKSKTPPAAAQASPRATRERDAKGHFVKQGGSAAAQTPAAAAPTPVAAAPTPARDAKGHFVKQGSAPEPTAATPERDAKGRFVKQGGTAAAPAPALLSTPQNVRPSAPAGGNGMVWVNLDSKVYHQQGDRWYGKTKNGKYMSEDEALRAGYRSSKSGEKSSGR